MDQGVRRPILGRQVDDVDLAGDVAPEVGVTDVIHRPVDVAGVGTDAAGLATLVVDIPD